MPPVTHVRSITLAILAAAQLLLQACTDPFVVGNIPPSAFQFVNIVPHAGGGPGGWKVAQVVILLGKLSPRYPETTLCEVEVGVPEVNRKGSVLDSVAQVEAAGAADEAARYVLKKKRLPTAVVCDEFRRKMQSVLTEPTMDLIPGAQVTFVQRAGEEFGDCMRWDTTLLWAEPCYRLRVSLPGVVMGGERHDEVICLLSLLAPVYALYASHFQDTGPFKEAWTRYPPLPAEFQPHEARLANLLESALGVTRLPNDVLFTPIPGLAPRTGNVALGKALLIDLLFTVDRW